jgi:prepilin-type N-terminal cleavage/methylation domain-containing protein
MSLKAFTLIELLVVIAIVGILSGLIIVSLNGATASAQNARTRAGIDSIRKTILAYGIHSGGVYPTETCVISSTTCPLLTSALVPDYYSALPDTIYSYTSSGTDFTVSAVLSNSDTYSYTASEGFSTVPPSQYASTCAAATIPGVIQCEESEDLPYIVNKFTLTGTATGTTDWEVPVGVTEVEYLVVAGGGGGGSSWSLSGGGGGGGVLQGIIGVSPQTYQIIVGAGGGAGNNGANSTFGTVITAIGGGNGGGGGSVGGTNGTAGTNGGSGGGGGGAGTNSMTGGNGTSGQGNNGGSGKTESPYSGGGGGGASSVGLSVSSGRSGGDGTASSITGGSITYGGGGAGGIYVTTALTGGPGGGGNGGIHGISSSSANGSPGINGLGGGGGGSSYYTGVGTGGAGGSGVVIIRYLYP